MNRRNRTIVALATFLVAVSVGVGTAIAVTLFYHHMPAVSVAQTMNPNCDPPTASPATVTIGSSEEYSFGSNRCLQTWRPFESTACR